MHGPLDDDVIITKVVVALALIPFTLGLFMMVNANFGTLWGVFKGIVGMVLCVGAAFAVRAYWEDV